MVKVIKLRSFGLRRDIANMCHTWGDVQNFNQKTKKPLITYKIKDQSAG
jgi:hypothetical protein